MKWSFPETIVRYPCDWRMCPTVGIDEEKSQALSYTAISEGILPVSIEARDGPHSVALQYAFAKTIEFAAR